MQELLGKTGFILSTVFYTGYFLFSLAHQRTMLSILVTALCALIAGLQQENGLSHLALSLETFRNFCWILFLVALLQHKKSSIRNVILLSVICALEYLYLFNFAKSNWVFIFHLTQSLFVLFLLEHLLRKTSQQHRKKIKPLCIGLAVLFIYDFAFFADTLLLNTIDNNFLRMRGWVCFFAAPFIFISLEKIKAGKTKLFISRNVVFNSTLLLAAGIYLLFMSGIGYIVKYIDSAWTDFAQPIFVASSLFLFATLFFSGSLRVKLQIFIVKNFYKNKYDYRNEWIGYSQAMKAHSESAYDLALASMMKPFQCQAGILFELNNKTLQVKALANIDNIKALEQLTKLAKHALRYRQIIDINSLKKGSTALPFSYDKAKIAAINQLSYIIPIQEPGKVQFVCMLGDIHHASQLDFEDSELMQVLSKDLSIFLDLHITNAALVESEQFIAFNQMSTFLIHDLKNVMAQLNLLSKNSQKHRHNQAFIDDAFITIDSAAKRLDKVLSHLLQHKMAEFNRAPFDLSQVLHQVCSQSQAQPIPLLSSDFNKPMLIDANREKMTNVLQNLIKNAQDACKNAGSVNIEKINNKGFQSIAIIDSGEGMTEDFIEQKLFKPFYTTKGNAGLGIGAFDAKKYIEQLGGQLSVSSILGQGSTFEIHLPNSNSHK